MKNIVAAVLALAGVVLLSSAWAYQANLKNSVRWTCDIVHEAYYKKSPKLNEWRQHCRESAEQISIGSTKQIAIGILNQQLDEIGSSHLSIYSPEKGEEMWDNKSIDNGLRVRAIDGAFIIYAIVPESAASEFEINIGDEITEINDEPVRSAYDVRARSGKFEIRRIGSEQTPPEAGKFEELEVVLLASELTEDLSPKFVKLNSTTGLLKIHSFLPQYFEKQKWIEISKELSSVANVIVDLRENAGGNFVAMLRALSPFMCTPTPAGIISAKIESVKDASGKVASVNTSMIRSSLPDDLDSRIQIDEIESESSVLLKTFDGYGCTNAKATVLVDSDTASTGEIFAHAMSLRPNTQVAGVPTAGEVVVARWFDLNQLGFAGYSLSVPIAGITTTDGAELEAEGITPSKLLFYDLKSARIGRDNWLSAVQ